MNAKVFRAEYILGLGAVRLLARNWFRCSTIRVNNSDRPFLAPGIKSRRNTWKVWLVNFWIRASNNFKDDLIESIVCFAVCCNCNSCADWAGPIYFVTALAIIWGAFSSKSFRISCSCDEDSSHGACSKMGWNKMRPWTFRWSPLFTAGLDLSLAEKRNFKLEESSWVWKAACAAPRQIFVILSFQKLNFILSHGLSTVGLRLKFRIAFCLWTFIRSSWSFVRFALSVLASHLRIVTADTRGIISFKFVIDDSKAIGYCSSFKIVVSSTDWSWGSLSNWCKSL